MKPDYYADGTKVNAIDPEGELVECIIIGAFSAGPVFVYKLFEVKTHKIFYATHEYVIERLG